jgi:hypothetical protein
MLRQAEVTGTNYVKQLSYEKDQVRFAESRMEDADFILLQSDGTGPYGVEAVKKKYPDKVIRISNFSFRGLHPDMVYIGRPSDMLRDPSLYHSLAVLEAFCAGRSEKWAQNHALTPENFEKLGLWRAWDQSIEEAQREDEQQDVRAANLVDEFCRLRCGFFAFNHPNLFLLHEYLLKIFAWASIKAEPADLAVLQDPLRQYDALPIYDFVAEKYGLPYRTTQDFYLGSFSRFVDGATFVSLSYESYRKAEKAKLFVDAPQSAVRHVKEWPALSALVSVDS